MTRLGLYHGPLFRGANGYETYGPYARYIAEFARHFEQVIVFAPVSHGETDYRGCPLEAANVRVVELPGFSTHVQAARHLPALFRAFRREIGRIDVINCRNTAPFGYLLYYLGRRRGVGFFYHFTSDPREILASGGRYRGLYGVLARAAYSLDELIQRRVMRRTWSFVNGRLPFERVRRITPNCELIISSTLTAADLHRRSSFDLHSPVRLLYVGYLKHMKGLAWLLEAVAQLRSAGRNVELHLVGSGPEEAALKAEAARRGIAAAVHFHGYVPMGPALTEHYLNADIFVFPSLSEGSPRVVLEALAHSLPVVSTCVGSVPDLILPEQTGLIVPLRDAAALAGAVVRFIDDPALRQRCARGGFQAAGQHTIERFIAPMVARARTLAAQRPRQAEVPAL